jgi:porin
MLKCLTLVVIFGVILTLNAWAEDDALKEEIEDLKQRIEELEKKQETDDLKSSDSNGMSTIARYVSLGGVLSGAYQYEWVDGPPDIDDQGRGALSFQPKVSITPTEYDEIFFLFGFAAGNGLNEVTPFNLAPWAATLEDDVKDINGRNRDYLLQAWYKHIFEFNEDHTLGLTGGIIDSTDYLDDNEYSNDEYTQFMNEALVNAPNAFLPSYDIGGAVEWGYHHFGLRGVYMNIGENDDGNNFNFYGVQLNYTIDTSLGEGHYRVAYNWTSEAFLDPDSTAEERREILIFSFDQDLGEILGAWIRFAFGSDKALVNYKAAYTGGINISGNWWGRKQDNIGIGYGYLEGADQTDESLKNTHVAEAYVNVGVHEYLSLTFDLQYMKDRYVATASDNNVDGWIAGERATCEF